MSYGNFIHIYSQEYTPTQNFYAMVFEEWPEHNKDIDPSDMPQLHDILANLKKRDAIIIKMLCGIGYDHMNYRQIGEFLGITGGTTSQVAKKAFRRCRSEKMAKQIKFLFATRNELRTRIAEREERIKLLEQWLDDSNSRLGLAIKALPSEVVISNPNITRPAIYPDAIIIEELCFSVRVYNCLKRSKKNTLSDLMKLRSKDLKRIRNLGRKGAMEVEQKLSQYGLSLLPDYE
jgi:predicted XRE-type DNA-binding protein